jgi:hypothetical protein
MSLVASAAMCCAALSHSAAVFYASSITAAVAAGTRISFPITVVTGTVKIEISPSGIIVIVVAWGNRLKVGTVRGITGIVIVILRVGSPGEPAKAGSQCQRYNKKKPGAHLCLLRQQ